MMVIFPLHFLVIFGTIAVNFGCGIGGLVQTMRGRAFTVPVVGRWVFGRFFRGRRPEPASAAVSATP